MDPVTTPAELAPSTANATPPTLVPDANASMILNVKEGPVADSSTPSVCPATTMFPSGSTAIALTWVAGAGSRSEEHTSELQSRLHLVCRLLLEKKKKISHHHHLLQKQKIQN